MTEVLIVGAGVVGCHAARELSRDHDVTVLDRDGIAAGATGLSAGLVAPTLFYGDVPPVARHANDFFRAFDGTHGFEFTERNRLDFAAPGDKREIRTEVEGLANEGFPVSYLDAERVEDDYPWFHLDDFVGAGEYRDTGWVDPYFYAAALASEAKDRGATVVTDVTVEEVLVKESDVSDLSSCRSRRDGTVAGVTTNIGTFESDTVVVAAGWRTPDLLPAGLRIPIRPYRTQVIVLEPKVTLLEEFPLARLGSEHLYFRPEHNGDLLVGGAHSLVDDPERASRDADESFKLDVAASIPQLVDGFDEAEFVNGWAGVDAATPDTRPIIDTVGPEGLVVATGFNGLGVMTSPVVGPTVRERLTGEKTPFPAETFALDRFESVSTEFEFVSTSEI